MQNKITIINGVEIKIGQKYIVQPNNPRKMKHRDRTGKLVEIEDSLIPSWANLKFDDTNRIGKITDISDLKNL